MFCHRNWFRHHCCCCWLFVCCSTMVQCWHWLCQHKPNNAIICCTSPNLPACCVHAWLSVAFHVAKLISAPTFASSLLVVANVFGMLGQNLHLSLINNLRNAHATQLHVLYSSVCSRLSCMCCIHEVADPSVGHSIVPAFLNSQYVLRVEHRAWSGLRRRCSIRRGFIMEALVCAGSHVLFYLCVGCGGGEAWRLRLFVLFVVHVSLGGAVPKRAGWGAGLEQIIGQ